MYLTESPLSTTRLLRGVSHRTHHTHSFGVCYSSRSYSSELVCKCCKTKMYHVTHVVPVSLLHVYVCVQCLLIAHTSVNDALLCGLCVCVYVCVWQTLSTLTSATVILCARLACVLQLLLIFLIPHHAIQHSSQNINSHVCVCVVNIQHTCDIQSSVCDMPTIYTPTMGDIGLGDGGCVANVDACDSRESYKCIAMK